MAFSSPYCSLRSSLTRSMMLSILVLPLLWAAPKSDGLMAPLLDAARTSCGASRKQATPRRLGSTSHGNERDPSGQKNCHCHGTPPVIGVFSQPLKATTTAGRGGRPTDNNSTTESTSTSPFHYVAASYVKWLEAGGARTVAIPYDSSPDVLDELFQQIHMVFLPGGDALLSPSVRHMLNSVHDSNHHGNAFPVWGTCLGMEFLLSHFGQGGRPLAENYDAENMSLPLLNVVASASAPQKVLLPQRSLYGDPDVYRIATTQSVTLNNHQKGMSPEVFQSNRNLTDLWRVTSTNVDRHNKSFVSTLEPVYPDVYPYYGVQYHPEKNMFEYAYYEGTTIPYEVIAHTPDAAEFSFRIARFAVALAQRTRMRRCERALGDVDGDGENTNDSKHYRHEYTDPIKFPPLYTYPTRSGINFEQVYLIPPSAASSSLSSSSSSPLATSEREVKDESVGGTSLPALSASSSQPRTRSSSSSSDAGPDGAGLDDARSVMQW